jgi:hypothetical protein
MEPALVRIATHEDRGKILVSTQALHAGQEVLREQPVLLVPAHLAESKLIYKTFCAQPPDVQVMHHH